MSGNIEVPPFEGMTTSTGRTCSDIDPRLFQGHRNPGATHRSTRTSWGNKPNVAGDIRFRFKFQLNSMDHDGINEWCAFACELNLEIPQVQALV